MIYMFLANGFEEVEALAPLDLLRRAGLEVTTVAVGCGESGNDTVIGAHGIKVLADMNEIMYSDPRPDGVILPGGMPGTRNLAASKTVAAALRACVKNGGVVGAICAAPSVLGALGLLKGKRATCFPGFESALEGAKVLTGAGKEEKVVVDDDGKTVTARGMGVATEFGLALVEVFCGAEASAKLKASIQAQ